MPKRRDQLLAYESHDPTRPNKKLSDPTVCPDCGATYIEGRWTWQPGPVDAPRRLCSACQRTRDHYPAGFVTVVGQFAREHRDEILRVARNVEDREKQDHPINRIMSVSQDEEQLVLQTTEIHLATAIGKALSSAFSGKLEIDYEEDIARVEWRRDE